MTIDDYRAVGAGRFPGHVGVDVYEIGDGEVRARLDVAEAHLAPNGYLHAGAIVSLADTTCGYGCVLSLPDGATGFTTLELKTNFVATALAGRLTCTARRLHGGRTTQVWDATVVDEGGRTLALFRCTQLVLWP